MLEQVTAPSTRNEPPRTTGIGSQYVDALEIGNEPQLYPVLPWYRTPAGAPQLGRPLAYDLDDYTAEFRRYARALPPVPLAGPSVGHSWVTQLPAFVPAVPRGGLVTFHAYAINRFGDAFRGRNCSTPGVSKLFASALWALDTLFAMARAGVDGVNIHTWRGSAAPSGLRLLQTTETDGAGIESWAVRAPGHSVHVVLINDSLTRPRSTSAAAPRTAGWANSRAVSGAKRRRHVRCHDRVPELRRGYDHRRPRRYAMQQHGRRPQGRVPRDATGLQRGDADDPGQALRRSPVPGCGADSGGNVQPSEP